MAFDPDKWLKENPPADAPDPAAMPGTTTTEQPKSWAEVFDYYQKAGRIAGNAFTFGMGDRARAIGQTLWGTTPAGGPGYDNALKEQVGVTEQIREENPQRAIAADITGAGAQGLLLGGAGLTTAGRMIGQPLLRRSLAAAGEGAVLGGLQGVGNTYTGNPMDYVTNAGSGAVMGGVLGSAAPAVGSAIGAGARKIMDQGYFGTVPGALAKAAQSDAPGVATLQNRGARAMLPDAGPAMKGVAQGAALPEEGGARGPGATALINNLTARDQSMPQAITNTTDQIFGPARTPSAVEAGVRGRMRAIGPEYDTLLNGPNVRAIDNSGLAQRLEALAINERGQTQQVIRQVRGMLDIPTNPGQLDPHPRALHATREEVRGMMNDENLNLTARGRLQQIYRELTDEIQRKVPGIRELDSRYAELGTQEAASTVASPGSRMFEKGRAGVMRPGELQDVMTEAVQPKGVNIGPSAEPFRLREAARAELDRIIGTNKNDLLALENLLGRPQDWNAQKLGVMFGRERADRMMQLLDNERTFRKTYGDVVENSQTANRLASKEALDASTGKIPLGTGVTGLLLRGAQWAKDKVMQTSATANRDRIAQILATNDPQELQRIIPELLAAAPTRDRRQAIIGALIQSGWTGGGAGVVPSTIRRK